MKALSLLLSFSVLLNFTSIAQHISSKQSKENLHKKRHTGKGTLPDRSIFNQQDSVTISGKIKGFNADTDEKFIAFRTFTINGKMKQQSIQIKPDGSFSIRLFQRFAGDMIVNYKNAFMNIYTQPGKKLFLEIKGDELSQNAKHKNSFMAKGYSANLNNDLFAFQTEFINHHFLSKADLSDKTQTDSTFAARRMVQLKEQLNFLNRFTQHKNILNPKFKQWQANKFIYGAAEQILLFPFLGKYNTNINEEQLTTLIKNIPIFNTGSLFNSAYFIFLNQLSQSRQIIININKNNDELRKRPGYNSVSFCLDEVDKHLTGLPRELSYYDILLSIAKPTDQNVLNRFTSVITTPYLRDLLNERLGNSTGKFESYSILAKLKGLPISEGLKDRLIKLFELEKGNNLFVDFWGDWCVPCMREMPEYPKLIASFHQKPIKFIFFASGTSMKSMLAIKEKNHIDAEFINLSKDEDAVVNTAFDFFSYPSHFVIDANGIVLSNTAKQSADISKALWPGAF